MSNNIKGKVVVIMGTSSGMSETTARLLSAQGADVMLGARRVDCIQALADEADRQWRQGTCRSHKRHPLRPGEEAGRRRGAGIWACRCHAQQRRAKGKVRPGTPREARARTREKGPRTGVPVRAVWEIG